MTSFATEFPVDDGTNLDRFHSTVKVWLGNSPHTKINESDFQLLGEGGISKCTAPGEIIECWTATNQRFGQESSAIIYLKEGGGMRWKTSIVFSKDHLDAWIGIRVLGEATTPQSSLPAAKKPRIIEYLLDQLGGSVDGMFKVQPTPHYLLDEELEIATDVIMRRKSGRLPIVYLSCGFDSSHSIDPNALSSDLAGLCHVVVEPTRSFSRRLQMQTQSQNVYGGTICIYWPDDGGQKEFFIGSQHSTVRALKSAIIEQVFVSLSHRIHQQRVTVEHVQSLVSRGTLDQIRRNLELRGSEETKRETNLYAEQFDKEISIKDERVRALEAELGRLKAQKTLLPHQAATHRSLLRHPNTEQEFYEGEFVAILVAELQKAVPNAVVDSRRLHVLQSILNANSLVNDPIAANRAGLKRTLNDYKKMSSVVRSELEGLGFAITNDGKHHKLVYKDDDRYTFTLSTSGSDVRGSKNAISDISKLLF